MFRSDLEHIIRASCEVIQQDGVIILGSQAILGTYGEYELPDYSTLSMEADVRPVEDSPDEHLANVIDGAIGEFSLFHSSYGIYAQGVGERTAILPEGWVDRLVPVSNENTGYFTGWCLDAHDLCASKLMANRSKDRQFVRELVDSSLINTETLLERVQSTHIDPERIAAATSFIRGFSSTASRYVAPELPLVDLDDPRHPCHTSASSLGTESPEGATSPDVEAREPDPDSAAEIYKRHPELDPKNRSGTPEQDPRDNSGPRR